MTESSEAFFVNKSSLMSFNELGEYIAMCLEYLENPQKHLANAKKIPVLKETYDVLIERLELKLTRIDNLIYCKNEFEPFGILDIAIADFNTLEEYYRVTEDDKRNIETEIRSKLSKINDLVLLLLKIYFLKSNLLGFSLILQNHSTKLLFYSSDCLNQT